MKYKIILVVDVQNQKAAESLLDVAKEAIIEVLNYEEEDFVSGSFEEEK